MMRKLAVVLLFALPLLAQEVDPAQLVREGVALYDQGQYDAAVAKYKQALAIDPKNTTAAYELGLTYAQKGDFGSCAAALQPVASAEGRLQVGSLVMLGNCLDSAGKRNEAVAAYRTAMKLAPDDPAVAYELGVVLLAGRQYGEARALLKKDVLARPGHAGGRFALAQAFQAEQFRVPAIFELLHYLALEPAAPRSAEAARQLRALLDGGVKQKDAKNIEMTVDPDGPTAEGDYNTFSLALALASAARFTEDEAKKSEFEQVRSQIVSVLAMFTEMTPLTQSDYTAQTHVPFFTAMKKAGVTDAFAGLAIVSLHLPGAKEWSEKNADAVGRYSQWIQPQRGDRPAGQMPVPQP
jgi:tetratricopeptide (TPR) repeat protein